MGPGFESPKADHVYKCSAFHIVSTRPVGQVVKTEASHAFNIGSNPVRVTIFLLTESGKVNIMFVAANAVTIVGAY